MKFVFRASTLLCAVMVAALASPFTYSILASGDEELIGISGTETLFVNGPPITEPGTTPLIDFFPYADGSDSILVGDSTVPTRFSQTYAFTYEVENDQAVNYSGIVLQGILGGSGFISFTENIFAIDGLGNETLVASFGNSFTVNGTTDPNGSLSFNGNSFTYIDGDTFDFGVTRYKVKKSFFLMVDPNGFNGNEDYAGIALIQQNHVVPEPASIAAALVGLAGLAARRRRKA